MVEPLKTPKKKIMKHPTNHLVVALKLQIILYFLLSSMIMPTNLPAESTPTIRIKRTDINVKAVSTKLNTSIFKWPK